MTIGASVEERRVVVMREVGLGAGLVVVAGLADAAFSGTVAVAVLLMAVACGLTAALASDWASRVAVGAFAVVVFVAFASDRFGDPSWSYTPLIGFGVMLGAGYRRLRQLEATLG